MNTRLQSLNRVKTLLASVSVAAILILPAALHGQSTSVRSQIAELSQRFNELERKYNLLKLEIDNLTAENNRLKQELSQFKSAKEDGEVEEVLNAKLNSHKKDTEAYVRDQYEKILKLLSSKIENVSTASTENTARPTTVTTRQQVTFSNDFPQNGHVYTIESGDTLSRIAERFGSTVRYIQNANKIADPNSIKVGDKLFIPVDKN